MKQNKIVQLSLSKGIVMLFFETNVRLFAWQVWKFALPQLSGSLLKLSHPTLRYVAINCPPPFPVQPNASVL
jgi:hypothetical protein